MRGSKRSQCPMRIKTCAVSKSNVSGPWKIAHTTRSSLHNHPVSADIRVHADRRRRGSSKLPSGEASTMMEFVQAQSDAGIRVANIRASILHSNPGSLVLAKDVSNAKMRARNQIIATQTPMEALFSQLVEKYFFFRYTVTPETNEHLYLFSAHPATIRLYKLHCDVLMMDATFKTNKHDLPLLNIIAMTGMNTVLPIAQC